MLIMSRSELLPCILGCPIGFMPISYLLHTHGVHDIKESGTASGAIHRTWADIKAKLGGGDHTLLETAEAGEDNAQKAYKDALEKELPLKLRLLGLRYFYH